MKYIKQSNEYHVRMVPVRFLFLALQTRPAYHEQAPLDTLPETLLVYLNSLPRNTNFNSSFPQESRKVS